MYDLIVFFYKSQYYRLKYCRINFRFVNYIFVRFNVLEIFYGGYDIEYSCLEFRGLEGGGVMVVFRLYKFLVIEEFFIEGNLNRLSFKLKFVYYLVINDSLWLEIFYLKF